MERGVEIRHKDASAHMQTGTHSHSPLESFVPALVARHYGASPEPPGRPETREAPGAVLFADISGFTSLAERLARKGPEGAEELAALLNSYFGRLIDLIAEHGGEVVKFAGDALLAVFWADDDLTGATCRAGACGLVVQRALAGIAESAGVGLTMRIGIGAGDVVVLFVGEGDRWECVVAGAPLRQMAAAEHEAATGQVVLAPEAWALVSSACQGVPGAHGCVRLDSIRATEPSRPAAPLAGHDGSLSPFVPRSIRERLRAGQTEWLSELRRITVLFVNLLDIHPEVPDLLERTQAAFAAAQATIGHFEGSINGLAIDDKGMVILAALGLPPRSHEDDPARGVQAAMALRSALDDRGLACSIGIATGRVFCGVVGSAVRRAYTVIGDPVNLAARLMQRAGGSILCDGTTYGAARAAIRFDALPPIPLKGKSRPVHVYEPRAGARPSEVGSALVGRASERATLARSIDALVSGEKSVVLLEGDAGVGKSTLVSELLSVAAARGVDCLTGAADSIEQATPYYAWRPVVARLLELDPVETADRGVRRQHLLRQMTKDPMLERLAPLLRDVVGVDIPDNELTAAMTGEVRAYNTQDLLVHLLRRATLTGTGERRPTTVVLEDAHWFDSASWALLRQVCEADAPILMIIASRPMGDAAPPEYARIRDAERTTRIPLAPLTLDETKDLVALRLGQPVTDEIAGLIHGRAEGNPFFTEELALTLREAGVFRVTDEGVLRLIPEARGTDVLTLPETVQGTILARIDRLDPRQQLMVKVASVIGRRFAYEVLERVYPVEPDRPHLLGKLEELERLEMTTRAAPEPDLAYLYKHETTREVAYSLLLYSQRRQLHRAVAETLEGIGADNLAALFPRLAYHWGRAEDIGKTLFYLEKAGEQALTEGAYKEAAGYFHEALRLHEGGETVAGRDDERRRAHWERQLGEAQLGLGNLPESRAALERAVALLGFPVPTSMASLGGTLARAIGRQTLNRLTPSRAIGRAPTDKATLREAALAYLRLLETYFFLAGTAETLNASLQALNIAEAAGPSPELARAYALTGWIVSMVPQPALTDLYLGLAAKVASTPEGRAALQPVQFFTGFSRAAAGAWEEGHAALEEAVELADRLGDKRRWIEAVCGLSTVMHYEGQFARRVEMGAGVLYTSARRQGDFQAEAWGLLDQIESLLPLGEMERAMTLLDALIPFLDKDIGRSEQVWGHGLLALGLLRNGEHVRAHEAAAKANVMSSRTPPVAVYTYEGYAGAAEVFLALMEERPDLGAVSRDEVVRGARAACASLAKYAGVFAIARPRSLLSRGLLAWETGRPLTALRAMRRSLEMAVALRMPYEEGRALYEIGRHLPAGSAERRTHLERAAARFDGLGSTWDLARTRAALAR